MIQLRIYWEIQDFMDKLLFYKALSTRNNYKIKLNSFLKLKLTLKQKNQ